jgi:hypothetical protein
MGLSNVNTTNHLMFLMDCYATQASLAMTESVGFVLQSNSLLLWNTACCLIARFARTAKLPRRFVSRNDARLYHFVIMRSISNVVIQHCKRGNQIQAAENSF